MIKIEDVIITVDELPVERKFYVSWEVVFSIGKMELFRKSVEEDFLCYIEAKDLYHKMKKKEVQQLKKKFKNETERVRK